MARADCCFVSKNFELVVVDLDGWMKVRVDRRTGKETQVMCCESSSSSALSFLLRGVELPKVLGQTVLQAP